MPLFVELLAGFALLIAGAEASVRGSIRLARRLGVSSLLVGLTVVALGTSLPELFVSAIAAYGGEPGVALGNVVGSNVFNLSVILGIGALMRPIKIEMDLLRLEIPFVLVTTLLFISMAWDGLIGRTDGPVLLVLFAGYIGYLHRAARLARRERQSEPATEDPAGATESSSITVSVVLVVVGLTLLGLGGRWLVESATELGVVLGISERVVGLTIVALATSLPELAASLVAARRNEADLAVGNLLGSNIFNTLGILGVSAVIHPLGPTGPFLRADAIVLVLTSVLLLPMARSGWRLNRIEGAILLSVYGVYMTLVLAGAVP
ncbi:MAG: calcium/sodium antiporter [Gemmatimonadetes bacterium]|nr:calcium/sodium antiporter [Gemmatimonadota bacterium]